MQRIKFPIHRILWYFYMLHRYCLALPKYFVNNYTPILEMIHLKNCQICVIFLTKQRFSGKTYFTIKVEGTGEDFNVYWRMSINFDIILSVRLMHWFSLSKMRIGIDWPFGNSCYCIITSK